MYRGGKMQRNIMNNLKEWKEAKKRKPLLLLGARQIGKTYILKEFGKSHYSDFVYINFDREDEFAKPFLDSKDPRKIIKEIEILKNKRIDSSNTLIIFDEIQACSQAISSLKYFNEEVSEYSIVCAGSLLGTMLARENFSFPVGKVNFLNMYPMTFDEFLKETNNDLLLEEIVKKYGTMAPMSDALHIKALELYRHYVCLGGFPEFVQDYIENDQDLIATDTKIRNSIVKGYISDMTKYCSSSESIRITDVYKSMPGQLGKENTKFKYSIVKKGARAKNYEEPVNWLIESSICIKSEAISFPDFPLSGYVKDNTYKLYLNDTGLLLELGEIPYRSIIFDEDNRYKGGIVENYVASSLLANDKKLYHYNEGGCEIDFIIQLDDNIIPIEVKAGERTRSISLNKYFEKYNPPYCIRISARNFGYENNIKSIPLYSAFLIGR